MRAIILAAGAGQRFTDAGHNLPKPLTEVLGKPMYQYTLDLAYLVDTRPLILATPFVASLLDCAPVQCAVVHHMQKGAALSLLCANGYVADNEPVLVMDCDNIIDRAAFQAYVDFIQEHQAHRSSAVCLTTVLAREPIHYLSSPYSHVIPTPVEPHIAQVVEKINCSRRITCGVHYFPSWSALRYAVCGMLWTDVPTKGEFYVAPVYNHLQNCDKLFFDIPTEAFRTVGTPEQLESYVKGLTPCE